MSAALRRLVAHVRRPREKAARLDPEPWEPIRTTAGDLAHHGLDPWPDAAGVSWPGGLIECRRHLTPSGWADDVTALVLHGRPGGTIQQRISRLCQRCRDDAARWATTPDDIGTPPNLCDLNEAKESTGPPARGARAWCVVPARR